MKRCLYCDEEIKDDALVCRFCGWEVTDFIPPAVMQGETHQSKQKSKMAVFVGVSAIVFTALFVWVVELGFR